MEKTFPLLTFALIKTQNRVPLRFWDLNYVELIKDNYRPGIESDYFELVKNNKDFIFQASGRWYTRLIFRAKDYIENIITICLKDDIKNKFKKQNIKIKAKVKLRFVVPTNGLPSYEEYVIAIYVPKKQLVKAKLIL